MLSFDERMYVETNSVKVAVYLWICKIVNKSMVYSSLTTAPHGRPNLRSRLHSCYAQEGGPRSPQRTCGGIGGEFIDERESCSC